MRWIFRSFVLTWLAASWVTAATVHVPGDQPTIQAGIDAAAEGDTVLVADGMYTGPGNLEISAWGKPVTIKSANGPSATTIVYFHYIDQVAYAGCFFFASGEDSTTVVEGFTLADSAEYTPAEGRAAVIMMSAPTFRNCIFTDFEGGTPVVCDNASPVFEDCRFVANTGGCSECKESHDRSATLWLGRASAVRCTAGSNAVFLNCDFTDNIADVAQGAVVCDASSPVFVDCRFQHNQGFYAHGAAVVIGAGSHPSFSNCLFKNSRNEGVGRSLFGGAVYLSGATASFVTCRFENNRVFGAATRPYGGAICVDSGAAVSIHGSMFTGNVGDTVSGHSAINVAASATAQIESSLFSLNRVSPPVGGDSTALIDLACTNIFGNEAGDWTGAIAAQSDSSGNLHLDPFFCDTLAPAAGVSDISPCRPENNGCATTIGIVEIGCLDHVPSISSAAAVIVTEDSTFVYVAAFEDPDGPDTAIQLVDVPSWCVVAEDSITGVPPDAAVDTAFTVIASDGYRADTLVVALDVVPVNDAPVLDTIPDFAIEEAATLTFPVRAVDPDGLPAGLSVEALPEGASFTDSANGAGGFAWTPGFDQSGVYELLVFAIDDSLAADSQTVHITVAALNRPPVIDSIAPVVVFIGDTVVVPLAAGDPDADSVVLTAANMPPAALFVDSGNGSGVFSLVADSSQIGSYSILVTASDSLAVDSFVFALAVVDTLPVLEQLWLVGEPHADHVLDNTPEIAWSYADTNQASVQAEVEIAVGGDSDWSVAEFWQPGSVATGDTMIAYDGAPLADGATCVIRLRVHNTRHWSAWTDQSFRLNTAPSPPVLLSPVADSYTGNQPVLWVSCPPDAELDTTVVEYAVGFDTLFAGPETLCVRGVSIAPDSTGWLVSAELAENTRYVWRARLWDGHELSSWSAPESASFWVNDTDEPPGVPGLRTLPDDSCALTEMLPTFVWSRCLDPDPLDSVGYRLHLATDPEFSTAVLSDPIIDTSITLADSLVFAQAYWWKVTAHDKTGNVIESPAQEFWTWLLGDIDNSHVVSVGDLTTLVGYIFQGKSLPCESKTSDLNSDCRVTVSDLTYLVSHLFRGGPAPKVGCDAAVVQAS